MQEIDIFNIDFICIAIYKCGIFLFTLFNNRRLIIIKLNKLYNIFLRFLCFIFIKPFYA